MSDSEAGEHRRGVFEAITDTVKNAAHLAVSAVVSMERAILPEFDVNDTPAEQQPESSLKEDRKSDDVPTSETWWTPTWTKENNTWVAKAREPGEQQMSTFEDVVSPQGKSVIDNIRDTLFGEKRESISPATKKQRDQLFEEIRQKGSTHDRERLFKEIRSQRSSFAHKKLLSDIRNKKSNQNRRQVLSEIRDRRGATRALSPRTKQLREALFFEIHQRKFGASPATAKLRKQLFAEIRQIGVTGALSPATKQLRESLFAEIRQRRFMASPNTQRLRQALFNDIIERKFVEPASPHTLKLREQLFKEIRQRKPLEPEEAEAVHHIVERAQHDKKFMEAVLLAEDPLKLANKDVHKGNFQQTHLPRTKESISDTLRR